MISVQRVPVNPRCWNVTAFSLQVEGTTMVEVCIIPMQAYR
jgi:hypothetical protein